MIDLDVKVEEITVRLKSIYRAVIVNDGSDRPRMNIYSPHKLLRVRSIRTKKQWVIDVTGEQYGIPGALWDWDEYEKAHTASTKSVHPFGLYKSMAERGNTAPSLFGLWRKIGCMATEHLDAAIKTWTDHHKLSVADIITLAEERYKESKASLLKAMNDAVHSFVAANQFDAEFQAAKAYERKHPRGSEEAVLDSIRASAKEFFENPLYYAQAE